MFSPCLLISLEDNNKPSLIAAIDKNSENVWIISSINVVSGRFHTSSKIHVGSTYSDLKKAYRKIEIVRGEGQVVALVRPGGMSFLVNCHGQEEPVDSSTISAILVGSASQRAR